MKIKIPKNLLKEIDDLYQVLFKADHALEEMYNCIDYWNDKLCHKYPSDYWGWSSQEIKDDEDLYHLTKKLEYVMMQYSIAVRDFRDEMQVLIDKSKLEEQIMGFGGVLVMHNLRRRVQDLNKSFAKSRKYKELNKIAPGDNFASDMKFSFEQLDKKLETVGDRRKVMRKLNFSKKQ